MAFRRCRQRTTSLRRTPFLLLRCSKNAPVPTLCLLPTLCHLPLPFTFFRCALPRRLPSRRAVPPAPSMLAYRAGGRAWRGGTPRDRHLPAVGARKRRRLALWRRLHVFVSYCGDAGGTSDGILGMAWRRGGLVTATRALPPGDVRRKEHLWRARPRVAMAWKGAAAASL